METRHWNDDDLLDRVYGLDPAPGLCLAHLDACPDCSARWQALELRRSAVTASQPLTPAAEQRLRNQRVAVFNRVERPRLAWIWRAVPAGAAAFLFFIGIALHRPAPQPPATQVASVTLTDEQLFAEIASVVNQDAPRAADPIRGLFAENSSKEAQ
ncbi:MAG: hypothetical protein HY858_13615 [Candidatus Solibacter usitatus]|nr:hypothetical protein [Candidatus Solibacter usitatus]